ncbi:MAG: hypothetical protein RSD57_13570 [Comamonas sp.]
MIPSKHPKCYHPTQGLASSAFNYQDSRHTDISQRFARARDDLQRPRFTLVTYGPGKPTIKADPKASAARKAG